MPLAGLLLAALGLAASGAADGADALLADALPFTAGGKTVAEDAPGLRSFYEEMLAEGTPKQDRVQFYTTQQIKKRRGSLPRGGDDDDMAFAWVELGGEDLILILQPASKGWRVVGIDR